MAAKAWVNPTLYVQRAGIDRQRECGSARGGSRRSWPDSSTRRAGPFDGRIEAVGRMIDAGVRMTAGSDSSWGWYAPGEFVHEIHMLAEAGLSSHDAIVAGTAGAAESIGTGQAAGRLAAGRQADVLVVKGDPVREISALWNVLDVYQGGQRVERGIR